MKSVHNYVVFMLLLGVMCTGLLSSPNMHLKERLSSEISAVTVASKRVTPESAIRTWDPLATPYYRNQIPDFVSQPLPN